ncbi:phage protein NinX family protein [Serratia nevei]
MTDYSKMSDLDINVLVGEIQGFANKIAALNGMRDYCNNPADAWPIIVGSKINIRFGAEGMACEAQFMQYGHESVEYYHVNPLRAAMIVFLMMKDAEKC